MRSKRWVVVFALLLTSCAVIPYAPIGKERQAVDLLNAQREVLGKTALLPNLKLFMACREYAPLLHEGFGHSVDGTSPDRRAREKGYWLGVAEALVRDYSLDEGFVTLMASPPHERILLGDYRDVGTAISERDGSIVIVYLLGCHTGGGVLPLPRW